MFIVESAHWERCIHVSATFAVTKCVCSICRLPRLMNRKFVDDFAVEFCMSLNTKLNRRKLAKALFSVEKNR